MAIAASAKTEKRAIARPVDVSPPGRAIGIQWAAARGATSVEVNPATVTVSPAIVEQGLGDLSVASQDSHRVVTVPAGRLIRTLTLKNLKLDDSTAAPSSGNLGGWRLAVAIIDTSGKVGPPLYSVPPVPGRGLVPPSLTGASYENSVLHLPDVAAPKLRLSLVNNEFPEEFDPVTMSLDGVSGVGAVPPKDLKLLEPDGSTAVWAFPGTWPAQSPEMQIDLSQSIRKVFSAALKAGQPLDATYHLIGAAPSQVYFQFDGASGALVRAFSGSISTVLEGDPMALALTGDALANEQPWSVTADVTIKYAGLRLLEDISDAPPPSTGGVSGPTVGQDPVLRPFPPQAFSQFPLARVGLVGRAPVDCELSVQWADAAGRAQGRPGVVKLKPSTTIGTVWVDIPPLTSNVPSVALSVRADQGRFFWASGSTPLTRFVVRDPDPGGRALKLNGTQIATVSQTRQTTTGMKLDAVASGFRSTPPVLTSSLFLTVVFSGLVLRYSR